MTYVQEKLQTNYLKISFCMKYKLMLYYDRTDVFESININKICASKQCGICHYWCFLNKAFKFQKIVFDLFFAILFRKTFQQFFLL